MYAAWAELRILDWSRPVLYVTPFIIFIAGLANGMSGMGGGIIATAIWLLMWKLFHIPGMDDDELLVLIISVQQAASVACFACSEWSTWRRLGWHGFTYALVVLLFSLVGSFTRRRLDAHMVQHILAWMFVVFGAWKMPLPRSRPAVKGGGDVNGRKSADVCKGAEERVAVIGRTREDRDNAGPLPHGACAAAEVAFPDAVQAAADNTSPVGLAEPRTQGDPAPVASELGCGPAPESEIGDGPGAPSKCARGRTLSFDMRRVRWSLPLSGACSGALNGLCGLGGPAFIVLVRLASLPKEIARPLFPLGMALEVPLRITMIIGKRGPRAIAADAHILSLAILSGWLGISVGSRLAATISQTEFEVALLSLMLMSAFMVLGVLDLSLASLGAALLAAGVLASRRAPPFASADRMGAERR